eukprot:936754-Rhodomonas_salina.2
MSVPNIAYHSRSAIAGISTGHRIAHRPIGRGYYLGERERAGGEMLPDDRVGRSSKVWERGVILRDSVWYCSGVPRGHTKIGRSEGGYERAREGVVVEVKVAEGGRERAEIERPASTIR